MSAANFNPTADPILDPDAAAANDAANILMENANRCLVALDALRQSVTALPSIPHYDEHLEDVLTASWIIRLIADHRSSIEANVWTRVLRDHIQCGFYSIGTVSLWLQEHYELETAEAARYREATATSCTSQCNDDCPCPSCEGSPGGDADPYDAPARGICRPQPKA